MCKGQGLGQFSALGCRVGNGATVLLWSHCVFVLGRGNSIWIQEAVWCYHTPQ